MQLNKATREALGKALYEASCDRYDSRMPQWEALLCKEDWVRKAEAVVEVYEQLRDGTKIR